MRRRPQLQTHCDGVAVGVEAFCHEFLNPLVQVRKCRTHQRFVQFAVVAGRRRGGQPVHQRGRDGEAHVGHTLRVQALQRGLLINGRGHHLIVEPLVVLPAHRVHQLVLVREMQIDRRWGHTYLAGHLTDRRRTQLLGLQDKFYCGVDDFVAQLVSFPARRTRTLSH
ncbi:Uncharacterised protein [Mycobacteroides abscessus subsp. massiliense]|nr:Uncharacterised protein [Mycobacteroides abscessus subsp. massiliense]